LQPEDEKGKRRSRKNAEGTFLAAALKYDGRVDEAPQLAAKGRGIVAEKIVELARKHGIPVTTDPALVQMLVRLDLEEQIPVELYRAVAEILAFVYSLNSDWREKQAG